MPEIAINNNSAIPSPETIVKFPVFSLINFLPKFGKLEIIFV